MDDLISRQDAIDAIHKVKITPNEMIFDAIKKAQEEEVKQIESESGWIPCSERLPEYGHPVLWCNENGSVFVSAITVKTDHSWAIGKRHRASNVIAWMPLPEPYLVKEVKD